MDEDTRHARIEAGRFSEKCLSQEFFSRLTYVEAQVYLFEATLSELVLFLNV